MSRTKISPPRPIEDQAARALEEALLLLVRGEVDHPADLEARAAQE